MIGTSAIYEYAATMIGPKYCDPSFSATTIAVGPSAAAIVAIETRTAELLFAAESRTFPTNKDGYIDRTDMDLLQNHIADPEHYPLTTLQMKIADCNQDGKVDGADLTCMQNYFNPHRFRLGDVNKDGYTNMTDVNIIEQYLAGNTTLTDFQMRMADINQDGNVTQEDVDRALRAINDAKYNIDCWVDPNQSDALESDDVDDLDIELDSSISDDDTSTTADNDEWSDLENLE